MGTQKDVKKLHQQSERQRRVYQQPRVDALELTQVVRGSAGLLFDDLLSGKSA